MRTLFEHSDARFSKCGKHRLWLCRIWDQSKPPVMFIGLNPSTANASTDDPTIRRVKSIANNCGYGGVYMMNLFTFISTDPKQLNIQEGNLSVSDMWLQVIGKKCATVICAWGNFKVMGRDQEVMKMFPKAQALFINKNGSPKHPLYVRSDQRPVNFDFLN